MPVRLLVTSDQHAGGQEWLMFDRRILWDVSTTSKSNQTPPAMPWYRGTNVPLRVIRRFARQVAEQFQPDKIILFGSHAYGQPHADSDVDILVVMPARNQLDQAANSTCHSAAISAASAGTHATQSGLASGRG